MAILMSPSHFDWARNFLQSPAWESIQSSSQQHGSTLFTLPEHCPSKLPLLCQNATEPVLSPQLQELPSFTETEPVDAVQIQDLTTNRLRRSNRTKELNKGFKKENLPR